MATRNSSARAAKVQAATEESPRSSAPATGTDTITVACKLPSGLWLRVFRQSEVDVPISGMPGQFRKETQSRLVGAPFRIAGAAQPVGAAPRALVVGGYALTTGVPRALWEEWLEQNRDSAIVRNSIVYAMDTREEAHDRAVEQEEVRSGLEPIDPRTRTQTVNGDERKVPVDPRWPAKVNPNLSIVATDTRQG